MNLGPLIQVLPDPAARTIATARADSSHFGVSEHPEAPANNVGELTPRAEQVNMDRLPSRVCVHVTIAEKCPSIH